MATPGGARALYLDHEIGSLEKGIGYSMNSRPVELIMVNGEVLVRDQHLTEVSEEEIIIQAERSLKKMMN